MVVTHNPTVQRLDRCNDLLAVEATKMEENEDDLAAICAAKLLFNYLQKTDSEAFCLLDNLADFITTMEDS